MNVDIEQKFLFYLIFLFILLFFFSLSIRQDTTDKDSSLRQLNDVFHF